MIAAGPRCREVGYELAIRSSAPLGDCLSYLVDRLDAVRPAEVPFESGWLLSMYARWEDSAERTWGDGFLGAA